MHGQLVIGDSHAVARRDDVDLRRLELDGVLDADDREGACLGQDLGQVAGAARVEVLRDDDRGRERVRQRLDQLRKGIDAAGRRADDDEVRICAASSAGRALRSCAPLRVGGRIGAVGWFSRPGHPDPPATFLHARRP
jgi:hypothetical protein